MRDELSPVRNGADCELEEPALVRDPFSFRSQSHIGFGKFYDNALVMAHVWVCYGNGIWAYYDAHSSQWFSNYGWQRDAQLHSQALVPDRAGYVYKSCGLCNIGFFSLLVQGGLEVGGERAHSSPPSNPRPSSLPEDCVCGT
jgi:hypothetical protein